MNISPELQEQLDKLIKKAEEDPVHLHGLGWFYDETLKDYETAKIYYEKSVEKTGKSVSIYNLASIIRIKEPERAIKLLQRIEKEDIDALFLLAQTDHKNSINYLLEGIERGGGKFAFKLYERYRWESHTEQNTAKSLEYLKLSAEMGCVKGIRQMYQCYMKGRDFEKDVKKETEWLLKIPSEKRMIVDWFNLGYNYYYGKGIEQNHPKSLEIFLMLDEKHNDPDAQYMIGQCYEYGKSVRYDIYEAIKWYEKSSDNDDLDARTKLVKMFLDQNDAKEHNKYLRKMLDTRISEPYKIHPNEKPDKTISIFFKALSDIFQDIKDNKKTIEQYESQIEFYNLLPPGTEIEFEEYISSDEESNRVVRYISGSRICPEGLSVEEKIDTLRKTASENYYNNDTTRIKLEFKILEKIYKEFKQTQKQVTNLYSKLNKLPKKISKNGGQLFQKAKKHFVKSFKE